MIHNSARMSFFGFFVKTGQSACRECKEISRMFCDEEATIDGALKGGGGPGERRATAKQL